MDRYHQEVQAVVPADRLLVWSASEGWEPLCEFLELPIPDAAFPRVNDSAQFGDRIVDGAIDVIQRHRLADAAVGRPPEGDVRGLAATRRWAPQCFSS